MQINKTTILIVACVTLTVFSGILRGRIDQRWGVSEQMKAAAKKVHQLPKKIGDWALSSEDAKFGELDESSAKMLRCNANIVANYQHQVSGQRVQVIFMVGPAGPLAQHTPEVCYGSMNYRLAETKHQKMIRDSQHDEHEFSVVTCTQNSPGSLPIRVYYSWNRQGSWTAPAAPRTAFAGLPMLYKIQVSTTNIQDDQSIPDAGEQFLQDSLHTFKMICD